MESIPLVSVLMTAYNREKYVGEAIESVLASTYTNFELILVDDCSSDQTYEIAKKYELLDKRIKVYQNEYNLGQFPNRNKAAEYASGKYIKFLDSDDLIYPHGLEVFVNMMEPFPEAGFGTEHFTQFVSTPFPIIHTPREAYMSHFSGTGLLLRGPSATIINTHVFKSNGGFLQDASVNGDTEFSLRIAAKYPIISLPPALVWWRQHPDQEFLLGFKNNTYLKFDFNLKYNTINSINSPLSNDEKKKLTKKIKKENIYNIYRYLLRLKLKKAFIAIKYSKIV
jgi:glycosyltransferase involved in cell wall biosynthesis